MQPLTLPPFDYQVKKSAGKLWIFDIIRRRYFVLTPEEWVRQHVVHFLIGHRGYPPALVAVEREISVCGLRRRFDIVCFDRSAAPYLVVECKAPSVELSAAVFDQAFRYNLTLQAWYVAITNGIVHHSVPLTADGPGRPFSDFPSFAP